MFYLAWKFRASFMSDPRQFHTNCCLQVLTQVFDQPDEMETGGMYFPMAIDNLCECFLSKIYPRTPY